MITEPQACNYQGTLYVDCSLNVFDMGTLCVNAPSYTAVSIELR